MAALDRRLNGGESIDSAVARWLPVVSGDGYDWLSGAGSPEAFRPVTLPLSWDVQDNAGVAQW